MIDAALFTDKTAAYYTLGCKLNFAESSAMGKLLAENGIRKSRVGEIPDVCIVNTCSVTELADKKCRQKIRQIAHRYPQALMVVTGCYAQLKGDDIVQMPEVDLVLGASEKGDIIAHLSALTDKGLHQKAITPIKQVDTFVPACSQDDRTRHFLKVQDGCNYYCTYCTIPHARGHSRNGSIALLVQQAQEVADKGGKEIVLTGVNIGDFGRTTGESLIDLLRALDCIVGIERYRISSIEPNLLTEEIIDFVAHSQRFMPHFHLPLQSGSDAVLQLMHRRYTTQLFAHRVEAIKRALPNAFIGVDLIVGMRGETDEYFEEAYRFVSTLEVSQLHVFTYSERPNTAALHIPHVVSPTQKQQRSSRMLALSEEKLTAFYTAHAGVTYPVLVEEAGKSKPMHGFTPNYIRVELPYNATLVNTIVDITLP